MFSWPSYIFMTFVLTTNPLRTRSVVAPFRLSGLVKPEVEKPQSQEGHGEARRRARGKRQSQMSNHAVRVRYASELRAEQRLRSLPAVYLFRISFPGPP